MNDKKPQGKLRSISVYSHNPKFINALTKLKEARLKKKSVEREIKQSTKEFNAVISTEQQWQDVKLKFRHSDLSNIKELSMMNISKSGTEDLLNRKESTKGKLPSQKKLYLYKNGSKKEGLVILDKDTNRMQDILNSALEVYNVLKSNTVENIKTEVKNKTINKAGSFMLNYNKKIPYTTKNPKFKKFSTEFELVNARCDKAIENIKVNSDKDKNRKKKLKKSESTKALVNELE